MFQELCNVFLFIVSVFIDWIASCFTRRNIISVVNNWDEEVILITGGCGGIGSEIIRQIRCRGTPKVIIVDMAPCPDDLLQQESISTHLFIDCCIAVDVQYIKCDLTTEDALCALKCQLDERKITPSILINCAGIVGDGTNFEDINTNHIHKLIAVNLTAPLRLIQMVLPEMIRRGKGSIVNMSSVAGIAPFPYLAEYGATKAALIAMNESLRLELNARHLDSIHTMIVCPYLVSTPMTQGKMHFEIPGVLTFLPVTDVAKAIVDGIQWGQEELCIPKIAYLMARLRLPPFIVNRLHRALNTQTVFDIGRR